MGPPEELMLKLLSEFQVRNFVETGTFEGGTTLWAAEHFQNVFTIELSKHFYEETGKKFKQLRNVKFIYGDSRNELKKLAHTLEALTIFWLDAHWSGGATYGDNDQCPLIEEIEIILDFAPDSFIFIDDARLFTSPPQPPHRPQQWADITTILNTLHSTENDKYVVIIEDVIIAVPAFAKELTAEYCQNVNAKLWEQYSLQIKKSNFRKGLELINSDLPATLRRPAKIAWNIYKSVFGKLRNQK